MAFETVETWHVKRRLDMPFLALGWSPQISANIPFRAQIEKVPSAALAIGLNGAFLYFLVTSAFDLQFDKIVDQSSPLEATMTMVDLGSASEEPELQPQDEGTGEQSVSNPVPSELDATIETEFPPEWSVGRIRVTRNETVQPAVSAGSGVSQGAGVGAGTGKGVYDPFAGAAPNRDPEKDLALQKKKQRPTLVSQISGFFGLGSDEAAGDEQSFESWVARLKQRLPRARGSVELSVKLGSDGTIKSAKIVGGSASPQVKFFVRNAAVGERFDDLSRGNRRSTRLPVVRLS